MSKQQYYTLTDAFYSMKYNYKLSYSFILMNIIYTTDATKTKTVMYWTYLQYARENDKRF